MAAVRRRGALPTIERLRESLAYCPDSGRLHWLIRPSNRVHVGDRAGVLCSNGYRVIGLDGAKFSAAMAAWSITHGSWPDRRLEHDNLDRTDDRIVNLRYAHPRDRTAMTAERARQLVRYDPTTGQMWRIKSASHNAQEGELVGGEVKTGYVIVGLDGKNHFVHRIAWLLMTGHWPKGRIDHKNGNGMDNRWDNLRDATPAINSQNQRRPHRTNTSGFLGVSRSRGLWKAQISVNNVNRFIGRYETAEEAHSAYVAAKRELHEGNML